jgi:hypothetical protein
MRLDEGAILCVGVWHAADDSCQWQRLLTVCRASTGKRLRLLKAFSETVGTREQRQQPGALPTFHAALNDGSRNVKLL